ncbi:hypothetical protein ABGM91_00665 [Akkermansia muciniphila]|uniref:hypothetical protein n=1 Tax=Akkermansia muciniphila TaxID=239935 RepID=UPI0033A581E0
MKTPYQKHAFRQYRSSGLFPSGLHAPIISGTKGCSYRSTDGDAALSGGAWKELHGASQASAATETMPGSGELAMTLREKHGIGKKECAFGSASVPLSVEACGSPGGRRARPF